MAGAQVPETILRPRYEARSAAPAEAIGAHSPVEGL